MSNDEQNKNLTEAKQPVGAALGAESVRRIRERIPFVKNKFKMKGLNTSLAVRAVKNYIETSNKNPRSSTASVFRKIGQQHQNAVNQVNQAVPIGQLINASDSQFRRIVRDSLREQTMPLNEQTEFNPPPMLLLKREALRMFPNGKRVVLYVDNKYGLSFPVPYDQFGSAFSIVNTKAAGAARTGSVSPGYVSEETVAVIFATGEEIQVEKSVMNKIKQVFESLNEENKERLSDMILESEETFNKVKEFALLV
jgi:uncharacterized protein (DUF885 family)